MCSRPADTCCVGFTVPTMYDTQISNWKPCKDPAIDDPTSRVPYLLDCRTGHAPLVLVVNRYSPTTGFSE